MRLGELCEKALRSIPAEADLAEVKDLFERLGGEYLLVMEGQRPLGLLSRHVALKARRFSLPLRAGDLANPDLPIVDAEEEALPEKLGLLLRNPFQRALILKDERPLGLLSPKSLLFSGLALPRHSSFKKALPRRLKSLLAWFYGVSEELGVEIYLVGGAVRDLLLDRSPLDLDIVVFGKLETLGRRLEKLGAQRCKRSLFETLKFRLEEFEIDLARARWEEYESPAALPKVVSGDLLEDLLRRDFTVNALALALSRPHFGRLVDFLGGLQDLSSRRLKVHHTLSFVDDPTRIFRAARYATRFGWDLSPGTRKALHLALNLKVLPLLSPARMRNEWLRILEERDPAGVINWLKRQGILSLLFSRPTSMEQLKRFFVLARHLRKEDQLEALALLLAREGESSFFGIPGQRFFSLNRAREELNSRREFLRGKSKLSEKVFFLERLPAPVLVAEGARDETLFPFFVRFFREYRSTKPLLSGKKLCQAGVPPGPKLGEMLKRLRAARLDGLVQNETEEWTFLQKEYPDVFST